MGAISAWAYILEVCWTASPFYPSIFHKQAQFMCQHKLVPFLSSYFFLSSSGQAGHGFIRFVDRIPNLPCPFWKHTFWKHTLKLCNLSLPFISYESITTPSTCSIPSTVSASYHPTDLQYTFNSFSVLLSHGLQYTFNLFKVHHHTFYMQYTFNSFSVLLSHGLQYTFDLFKVHHHTFYLQHTFNSFSVLPSHQPAVHLWSL